MTVTNVEAAIREYLAQVVHLSLATSQHSKPWVCEVHFVYDEDLNLYFRSSPGRRHSVDIHTNPAVAGNVVAQHRVDEKVRGVYFEGTAQRLDNVDEHHPAYALFCQRLGKGPEILEAAKREDGNAFYQITVDTWYLYDARETHPSQKYILPWGVARRG